MVFYDVLFFLALFSLPFAGVFFFGFGSVCCAALVLFFSLCCGAFLLFVFAVVFFSAFGLRLRSSVASICCGAFLMWCFSQLFQ